MNLNIETWKEFKIGKLFRLEPTKGKTTDELEPGNDIPYIAAKHDTNGLMQMCKRDGFEDWVSKGNCIVFIQLGAGSAGYANYVEEDFIGMNGKTCCGYIDGILNKEIGLFLETILCQERPKYSFGRSWTGDRLKETIIALPIKKDINGNPEIDISYKYSSKGYIPDWEYMENYIKSLHYKPITTKNKKDAISKLDISDWQEFKISSLFTVETGGDMNPNEEEIGDIPVISLGFENNGICMSIKEAVRHTKYNGNTITCAGWAGGLKAFYQPNDYYVKGRVKICIPKFDNDVFISNFICSIINLNSYLFSYGRKASGDKFLNITLRLPIQKNKDGSPLIDYTYKYNENGYIPDWAYMQNYMKSLPYGDKLKNLSICRGGIGS